MGDILRVIARQLMRGVLFFASENRKIAIERWFRGRDEARRLRAADYVLVSWAKSGRTWLRLMVSRFYQTRHDLAEHAMLGFDNLKRIDPAIPSLYFTHGNYLRDYTGNHDSNVDFAGKRIVLLVRDPRDIAVSQYFQWRYRMRAQKKLLNGYPAHGEELSVYDFVLKCDAGLPKIIRFLNLWARELSNLHAVVIVRYEDMRANPEQTLARVLEFMGTPGNDEEVREAVAFAAYDNMKKMENEKVFHQSGKRLLPGQSDNPDSFKTRRAKVGGWRDYFDDDQVAEIEAYVNSHLLPEFGYVGAAEGQQAASA
jgi:hypothetical protein